MVPRVRTGPCTARAPRPGRSATSTTWSTESYDNAQLSKDGVGVIIDASPGGGVAAQRMQIRTPTPGFEASIWVADSGSPRTAPPQGWTRVSSASVDIGAREQIDLDTAGNRYGRYLVWITKLPPGQDHVGITQVYNAANCDPSLIAVPAFVAFRPF